MAQGGLCRVLNVAEKNDAAKSLANIMARGRARKRDSHSKYNKIFEFDYDILNRRCSMLMTSVSGHLTNLEFANEFKTWSACTPAALFTCPIQKVVPENFRPVKRTLEEEARRSQVLILWTDGDREGENIAFEIYDVCKKVNRRLDVYRARFSEITAQSVARASRELARLDDAQSAAVDARQELDFRIGCAFTRFQTMHLQRVFPAVLSDQTISYGPCQFPTLGFVVDRYKAVQAFIAEGFYKIKVTHQTSTGRVDFNWKRVRLFDRLACEIILELCQEANEAKVLDIRGRSTTKYRPQALDTVELEKLASRKLKLNAKDTMKIAEKLYTQGIISYPRTETNIFPQSMNLTPLIQAQTQDPDWGGFAANILANGGPNPRNGRKSDNAHPPIHPTQYRNDLQGNERRVYEFVVRHFLACCSKDAKGFENTIEIEIGEERFTAHGLQVQERNFLDVYPYEKWSDKELPMVYQVGQVFQPSRIEMAEGETTPPPLLHEADLIALMDKHGIGTDATHAEHIETIKTRRYVGVQHDGAFVPGELGMGLVNGYDSMGFQMSKPELRAELEADLKLICERKKSREDVVKSMLTKYQRVFDLSVNQSRRLDDALAEYFGNPGQQPPPPPGGGGGAAVVRGDVVGPCAVCSSSLVVRQKKDGCFMIGCAAFPSCRARLFFPEVVTGITLSKKQCRQCQPGPSTLIKLKFKRASAPAGLKQGYEGCGLGCDHTLMSALNLKRGTLRDASSQQASRQHTATSLPGAGVNSHHLSNTSAGGSGSYHSTTSAGGSGSYHSTTSGGGSTYQSNAPGAGNSTYHSGTSAGGSSSYRSSSSGGGGNSHHHHNSSSRQPDSGFQSMSTSHEHHRSFLTYPSTGNIQSNYSSGESCISGRGFSANSPRSGQGFMTSGFSTGTNSAGDRHSRLEPDDDVTCNCGESAVVRTVRKEGPNTGRQFYGCPKPMGSTCGFFVWADEAGGRSSRRDFSTGTGTSRTSFDGFGASTWQHGGGGSFSDNTGQNDDARNCICGLPAIQLTVHKQGPNTGRLFWKCRKNREDGQCNFFQWDDEEPRGPRLMPHSRGSSSLPAPAAKKRPTDSSEGTKAKRKSPTCSVCREIGHTKRTCPLAKSL